MHDSYLAHLAHTGKAPANKKAKKAEKAKTPSWKSSDDEDQEPDSQEGDEWDHEEEEEVDERTTRTARKGGEEDQVHSNPNSKCLSIRYGKLKSISIGLAGLSRVQPTGPRCGLREQHFQGWAQDLHEGSVPSTDG